MKIAEYFYEEVLEPSYKHFTREESNLSVHSRNMKGRDAPSKYNPDVDSAGKCKKRHVYFPSGELQLTCLVHVPYDPHH